MKFAKSGSAIAISNNGRTIEHTGSGYNGYAIASSNVVLDTNHPRAYFEVHADKGYGGQGMCGCRIGVVRPKGMDHDKGQDNSNDAWWLHLSNGGLWGNGVRGTNAKGEVAVGSTIGVLVDLDAGSISWYKNGELYHRHTAKVSGVVTLAVQLGWNGQACTIVEVPVLPGGV